MPCTNWLGASAPVMHATVDAQPDDTASVRGRTTTRPRNVRRIINEPSCIVVDKLSNDNGPVVSEPVEARRRHALERLVREAAWLREAKEAGRTAPVNLTALQVLALLALEVETSFDAACHRLHIKKANLSRALTDLREARLIEPQDGRYRDRLPRPNHAGEAALDAFVAALSHRQ